MNEISEYTTHPRRLSASQKEFVYNQAAAARFKGGSGHDNHPFSVHTRRTQCHDLLCCRCPYPYPSQTEEPQSVLPLRSRSHNVLMRSSCTHRQRYFSVATGKVRTADLRTVYRSVKMWMLMRTKRCKPNPNSDLNSILFDYCDCRCLKRFKSCASISWKSRRYRYPFSSPIFLHPENDTPPKTLVVVFDCCIAADGHVRTRRRSHWP